MDKHVVYKTDGVCAKTIEFDIVDGIIHNVKFIGGCKGNAIGMANMVEGEKAEDVMKRLKGVDCRGGNSCPDQLALAIKESL